MHKDVPSRTSSATNPQREKACFRRLQKTSVLLKEWFLEKMATYNIGLEKGTTQKFLA